MPATELQKKAVYFLIFTAIVALILVFFSEFEVWIKSYLSAKWLLVISPDETITKPDGTIPQDMSGTWLSIVINLLRVLKIILWMTLVIGFVRFVSYMILRTALRNSSQGEISSLIKIVLSVIIYIVAFFIIFQSQYPNVQLAPLFTGSTILGIVVGLALQDTLGNLFAGLALQADQSFQVGDVISITNRGIGVVESVSWRGVKIRTRQSKLLVISNAVLGKEIIEVAPRDNFNARLVSFSTLYSASPARTIQLVREAVRQAENVTPKIRPVVRIRNLGESSIEWEVKYWLEDYAKHNTTDALIRQLIWYVFQREKISFPSPSRTLHIVPSAEEMPIEDEVNTNAERLNAVSIFAPLSDEETERLAKASKARIYAPGEAIVRIGKEGNSMFVIIRGSVDVQITENGVPKTVNSLGENDFFGEMSLLTGEPRSATVVAVEETEVLQIRKNALKPIFESNPALVESIYERIEERKKLNETELEINVKEQLKTRKSVMGSIRKFFGLR